MSEANEEKIRAAVRTRYRAAVQQGGSCCGGDSGCCGGGEPGWESARIGYSAAELGAVPAGANLGLGCGNPQAIAALKPGEVVLDLGSGAGFDCFLAAQQVGEEGYVIGVDMTPEMVARARANAREGGYSQVSFRLGEIEALPVADNLIDVIISNCVINLSTDKLAVFVEAFRVLKPGGRLAISDVVATAELPLEIRANLDLYAACAAGALTIMELKVLLAEAGFIRIDIKPKDESRSFITDWASGRNLEEYVVSASITAEKPISRSNKPFKS